MEYSFSKSLSSCGKVSFSLLKTSPETSLFLISLDSSVPPESMSRNPKAVTVI